jgi:O-antigen ligase
MLGGDRANRRRLVTWLVALGAFEAIYGLVQYLTGWQRIFGYVKKYNLEEATGTYINRNHFAGFLEMVIPFGVALVLYENAKLPRKVIRGRNARIKRVLGGRKVSRIGLWLLTATVMVAGLLFSLSRMGIISAVASLAVMAAFSGFQRKEGLWVAAAIMACGIILVLWMGAGPALGRFGMISGEYANADESRWSLWKDTARLIGGHPLLGSGLGTFPVAFTRVQSTFLGQFVNHAHNDYLEIASDLGIPAAALFFGSTGALLVRVTRKAASSDVSFERAMALGCLGSIAAILLHSLTDFNLYIPANALVFSLILGLAASIPAVNSAVLSRANEA